MFQNLRPLRARSMVPHLIGIVFGCLWGSIAAQVLPPGYRSLGIALVVVLGIAFLLRMRKRTSSAPAQSLFRSKAYLVAVVAEVAAIYLASVLFSRFGGKNYFIPTVGMIVGLHFIGLWNATGSKNFLKISAAMCFVSGLSMLLPFAWQGLHPRELFLGTGNAFVLWIGASEGS